MENLKTLSEIYKSYSGADGWGDKGTAHTYIEEYEKLFAEYRYNCTFLEIGIAFGHSMEMWCDFFIDSTIIGVDIKNHGVDPNNGRYKTIFCDATKTEIKEHLKDYKFDIIIDDGSHNPNDQINSFNILKEFISSNGVYIIEDITNIEIIKNYFLSLKNDYSVEIIDNRNKKNRYDDILILIRKKHD